MKFVAVLSTILAPALAGQQQSWPMTDARNIYNGTSMIKSGYLDQPYCVINHFMNDEWQCVVTMGSGGEGAGGEHMVALWSSDNGKTWSKPATIDASAENAYGNIVLSNFGRLYTVYNINKDHLNKYPDGSIFTRTDMLGYFHMKWSDDGGRSWSNESVTLPYRQTWVDRVNTFSGEHNIFWSVDHVKRAGSAVIFGFTKIGQYLVDAPEESWFWRSPNLLDERDATKVIWQMLPEGDHGLAPPGGNPDYIEEVHIMPLRGTQFDEDPANPEAAGHDGDGGYWATFRTTQGWLGAASTADQRASSQWSASGYAKYWVPSLNSCLLQWEQSRMPDLLPVSQHLKNPRGPITPRRLRNGLVLMLYYHNGATGFMNRNPYWLTAGRECHGTILWGQPEIALYQSDDHVNSRPGYPDIIEYGADNHSLKIAFTETQKTDSRVHYVPEALLRSLYAQWDKSPQVTKDGLVDSFNGLAHRSHDGSIVRPSIKLPLLSAGKDQTYAIGQGFTVEFWLSNHTLSRKGDLLLDTMGSSKNASGLRIIVGGSNIQHQKYHALTLVFRDQDGVNSSHTLDPQCAAAISQKGSPHQLAFSVDAGPGIVQWVVDGMACNGGAYDSVSIARAGYITHPQQGWNWLQHPLGNVSNDNSWKFAAPYGGALEGGRVYGRALYNTELTASFRAGAKASFSLDPAVII